MSDMVSQAKVEKVVKAPRKPMVQKSLHVEVTMEQNYFTLQQLQGIFLKKCFIETPMKSIMFPIIAVVSFVILSLFALLSIFLTNSNDTAHNIGRLWARIVLWAGGVRLRVSGQENIPMGEPVVFASNHASQMDIPILYLAIPVQFRFIVKKELFKIPLFGLAMKKTGYIPIDRSGGRKSLKSIQEAAERIKNGTSVVVFPEGTRSRDGKLGPFKVGGILVALKAKCQVVPVAISGSNRVLPKGRIIARSGEVQVSIGKPLAVEIEGKAKSKEEITQDLWNTISGMLKN